MIPNLNSHGLLPAGVHDASLAEVRETFASNPHRLELWSRFEQFLTDVYRPAMAAPVIWIDGSFVTAKVDPGDIDIVADCTSCGHAAANATISLCVLRGTEVKARYSVHLFPRHPQIPNDMAAFFQYAGEKTAIARGIDPKSPKGIVRVTL